MYRDTSSVDCGLYRYLACGFMTNTNNPQNHNYITAYWN